LDGNKLIGAGKYLFLQQCFDAPFKFKIWSKDEGILKVRVFKRKGQDLNDYEKWITDIDSQHFFEKR
jgi:hypothetical protein